MMTATAHATFKNEEGGFPSSDISGSTEVLGNRRRISNSKQIGSLPFKKRRLLLAAASLSSSSGESVETTCSSPPPSLPKIHQQKENCSEVMTKTHIRENVSISKDQGPTFLQEKKTTGDERLAVLALLSASQSPPFATTDDATTATTTSSTSPATMTCFMIPPATTPGSTTTQYPKQPFISSSPVMSDPRNNIPPVPWTTTYSPTSSSSSVTHSPKRSHHLPRLDSPLPNGCHGRTSRNNSYCRRQPYKGGIYCKLHHQQYILRQQAADPSALSPTSATGEAPKTATGPLPALLPGRSSMIQHNQDKRYMPGSNNGEVRCKATTTRGRECAYISQNGTKYCYLHADYDNNPPPRRGGGGGGGAASLRRGASSNAASLLSSFSKTQASTSSSLLERICNDSHSSSLQPNLQDIGKSVLQAHGAMKKTLQSASSSRGSSLLLGGQQQASASLLSMIATDEWAGKKVIIQNGPLINRIGRVEKWGNGWVSVRVDGVGIHNRRSFELIVQPDQSQPSTPSSSEDESRQVTVPLPQARKLAGTSGNLDISSQLSLSRSMNSAAAVTPPSLSWNNSQNVAPTSSSGLLPAQPISSDSSEADDENDSSHSDRSSVSSQTTIQTSSSQPSQSCPPSAASASKENFLALASLAESSQHAEQRIESPVIALQQSCVEGSNNSETFHGEGFPSIVTPGAGDASRRPTTMTIQNIDSRGAMP